MLHFIDEYADQLNRILHTVLNPTWFYKQEIVIVPDLVTAVFVTYDGVRDDSREIREVSWDDFVKRIRAVDPDWDINPEFIRHWWLAVSNHLFDQGWAASRVLDR
jgi:hypothetical protein